MADFKPLILDAGKMRQLNTTTDDLQTGTINGVDINKLHDDKLGLEELNDAVKTIGTQDSSKWVSEEIANFDDTMGVGALSIDGVVILSNTLGITYTQLKDQINLDSLYNSFIDGNTIIIESVSGSDINVVTDGDAPTFTAVQGFLPTSLTKAINNLDENKVDKVAGKELSDNNFTTALKTLLETKKVKDVTIDAVNNWLVITYTDDTTSNLNINDIVTDINVIGASKAEVDAKINAKHSTAFLMAYSN